MRTLKFAALVLIVFLTSCVSQKKFTEIQNKSNRFQNELKICENERLLLENNFANEKSKIIKLEDQDSLGHLTIMNKSFFIIHFI